MLPSKFHVPWVEIDPSLQHGGVAGELEGQFVGPALGDNSKTTNVDMYRVFRVANDISASLSMRPDANMEGPPVKNSVEEVLQAVNLYIERVRDRTTASSTKIFQWTHATPPYIDFKLRPVRYPLRNEFMHDVIFHWIGTQVEIAEMNANALHANVDPSSCVRMLVPILHMKANIIKDWFDKEVAGEVSVEEIAEMFVGITQPGPTIVPSDQTMPSPSPEAVTIAMAGVDLVQWYPSAADWQVFGKKRDEMLKLERIWQPEGSRRTTEDVAPELPVKAGATIPAVG